MPFLDPDILAETCGLTLWLPVTSFLIGLALWLFGWWCHRFWVVLVTTVLAGVYGLSQGPALRAQPVLAAILLALAAGLLALALVRLLAFLAGGIAGLLLVQTLAPGWDQGLLAFVACGLAGLLLFRFWMMALTSLTGTLLMCYSGLALLNYWSTVNALSFSDGQRQLVNWLCSFAVLAGIGAQVVLDRRFGEARQKTRDDKAGKSKKKENLEILLRTLTAGLKPYRKAG